LAPKHMRGRAFACCQAVGFCCVPMVAFLAYLLVPIAPLGLDGWRWIVLIGAQAAIFIWFMRRALPESPRWLARQGRLDEADRVLAMIEARVEAEYGRPLPAPEPPRPVDAVGGFSDLWTTPVRNRVIMLSVFNVFQTVGFYGFANWVPTLLIHQGITVSTSLGYTSLIAIAAPVGPLLGLAIGDRVERKTLIVVAAAGILVCGLLFAQTVAPAIIVLLGVGLTLSSNVMSYSFHAYQQELFPTGIRARASGFVYSWSRLSAIFSSFIIASLLGRYGSIGVFIFIGAAMMVVIATIGLFGPRTKNLSLEQISH
jgi:MFS transporter, putative metabolite:H+ symporter